VARYEVAVVGGGLVGAATAYELGLRGVRTLLVDRADAGRATDAGAGILSPATTTRDDPHWDELVQAAGEHHDQLIPRLVGETGWARCGMLQLATRESDVPRGSGSPTARPARPRSVRTTRARWCPSSAKSCGRNRSTTCVSSRRTRS
jgi:glycine/D-amino acid oxidase-like deaminating enzyme